MEDMSIEDYLKNASPNSTVLGVLYRVDDVEPPDRLILLLWQEQLGCYGCPGYVIPVGGIQSIRRTGQMTDCCNYGAAEVLQITFKSKVELDTKMLMSFFSASRVGSGNLTPKGCGCSKPS